jgi:ubiquinol-cytochrome c reductase cytochrome c1 subunit
MLRGFFIAAVVALAPLAAHAAEAKHPHPQDWSFEGPFGTFDQGAVQRGFQVYKEVCASCHTMSNLTYRHLGEKGGPFVASGKWNAASGAWEDIHLGPPHHGRQVPAPDNPYVRAIAESYEITEIDPTTGEEITRKARPADRFVSPYTNPYQAKAIHGVAPPDLSVITKARHDGANYVYAILTGYSAAPEGETAPGGATNLHYNPYFAGGWISMPSQLTPDRVSYSDGKAASVEQMARDVVTFLAWASEPKQVERKKTGLMVIIYLTILAGLLYAAYRQVWRDVKH